MVHPHTSLIGLNKIGFFTDFGAVSTASAAPPVNHLSNHLRVVVAKERIFRIDSLPNSSLPASSKGFFTLQSSFWSVRSCSLLISRWSSSIRPLSLPGSLTSFSPTYENPKAVACPLSKSPIELMQPPADLPNLTSEWSEPLAGGIFRLYCLVPTSIHGELSNSCSTSASVKNWAMLWAICDTSALWETVSLASSAILDFCSKTVACAEAFCTTASTNSPQLNGLGSSWWRLEMLGFSCPYMETTEADDGWFFWSGSFPALVGAFQ